MEHLRNATTRQVIAAAILSLGIAAAVAQSDPGQVAFSLEREGKLAEAEAAWSALAKQYPTNPEPLAHIGFIESRQGHYTEAAGYYKRAMALNPRMPGLRLNLGLAFFKAGDYKRSIQSWIRCSRHNPIINDWTFCSACRTTGWDSFQKLPLC